MRVLCLPSSVLGCTGLVTVAVFMSPLVPRVAAQPTSPASVRHREIALRQWTLVTEIPILPEPVGSRQSYRLSANGAQLIALQSENHPVFAWRAMPDKADAASRNIGFARAFEDPNFGDAAGSKFVRLKESVALHFKDTGYLVYAGPKNGPSDLNRAANSLKWQGESHFNQVNNTPDIYQWKFEIPRDHRDAVDLTTKTEVALFNIVAKCYLVVRDKKVAWQRP